MNELLIWIIAAIWLEGACVRLYRQARFYQIEEYMSLRYLRWMVQIRSRWLPNRLLIAWIAGSTAAFLFSEAPDSPLPAILGIIAAIIAVIPPDEGEIKKKFRATPRARRLLATGFVLAALLVIIGRIIAGDILRDQALELQVIAVGAIGFLVWLIAPVILSLSNVIMTPVEATVRAQFINHARGVLREVNPVVIGITGSYGKTSTKTYLAHILNGRYKAYPTPKSYNTLMGVCIALNNDVANDHSIEYFIAEMGAYVPGEIQRICELTHPEISIVVEVGPQHLERFGTLENVAIAKYEIIKALPPDGVGVFNWDNPHIRAMVERGYPTTRLTVSKEVDPAAVSDATPRFVASDIQESLDGLRFTVTDTLTNVSELFSTPLLGQHNVTNVLLATAVAIHEGMSLKEIARRVRDLKPAESRLTRHTSPEGITIINDAYSANPVGVVYALRVLGMHTGGRRLLITPGMVELGDLMESENRKLGETAAQYATDVILVGEKQAEPIREGLIAAGFPSEKVLVIATLAESIQWYQRNLKAGDSVLFLNDLPDTYSS